MTDISPSAGIPVVRRLRRRGLVVSCAGALAAALLAPAVSRAESPDPPPYYAIENARVEVGDGTVLERATVLVADGLIEAVGPDLPVPADAWRVDGEGLTVYPGLIDPLSSLGMKGEEEGQGGSEGGRSGGAGRGSSEAAPVLGPESRPSTEPGRDAVDHLDPEADYASWRDAGYGAALTSFSGGFFNGRAGVIHLGAGDAKERVLARSVAQHMGLDPLRGFASFPSSLMGVLAYVDQTFMDTRHYMASRAEYERDPAGHKRPLFEAPLEALAHDLDAKRPFLIPADSGLQLDRALAMAKKHGLQAVIYGARGAYARQDELAGAKIPVLVGLDWPEEEKDRDPDADRDFRRLFHQRLAPTVPSRLAAAGVPFAFYSDGLSGPSDVFEKVRVAVEAGLAHNDALRALTLSAAEILGVDDRLGTVAAGKIANLVLASDAPWAEGAEVQGVFVDGRYFFEREEEEEEAQPPAGDVSGTWALKLKTPRGVRDIEAKFDQDAEGKVTGELKSERGDTKVEKGRLSGDRLTFESTRTMGSRSMTASYSLALEGEKLSGTLSAGPMIMDLGGERTAKKEAKAEGDEGADTKNDEPAVSIAEMEEVMAVYQGKVADLDRFAVTHAKIYPVTGDVIEDGTLLVSGGKIEALGADVSVPDGYTVFDAAGGSLIPGIIDAHSHAAIDGAGNEGSLAVTAMVTIQDVVDPNDITLYRALAGGVTTINVLHGSANPIGGGNAVLKLRWGGRADDMRFEGAPAGIKFALGENPKRSRSFGSGPRRYPATRMGVMDVIRQAFTEAEAYRREWKAYDDAVAASKGKKKSQAASLPDKPRRDRKLEALAQILDGERLVHAHSYRADEILQLLRLAEEFGFKVATLQHVLEGYKVADELAAHGAGASTFSDWWGYKMEAYDAIPHNAAIMTERGVVVSINSDSGEEMRHLNQEAAKTMRWGGMSHNQALRMVTLNPALQLGIADRVGSLEVGKDADMVLYDGDPLSVLSVVQKTFVDGDLYFDLEADRARQAKIDDIKARLHPPEDDKKDGEGGDGEAASEDGDKTTEKPTGKKPTGKKPTVKETPMTYSCHWHEGGH